MHVDSVNMFSTRMDETKSYSGHENSTGIDGSLLSTPALFLKMTRSCSLTELDKKS
ncbi:MAG: hypothetical protein NC401_13945 [Ruminococcus sp.]|nr:hypothetical protein [Ruminococcus sp.]